MASGEGASDSGFEQLPYPSLPQPYAQPAHLAALAILHGLTPPQVATARVLEIGCAAGGHIIPLAARFPSARFFGFDLSPRHIADGQRRVAALGLTNIVLREGDVTKMPFGAEQFDYIVCHGLYSWVPAAAQQAILQLCHDCLAPDGVAAISYNVLPGWHLRRVVRDICIAAAGHQGPPIERVARARKALDEISVSANDSQPYGALLRQEAKRLARQPSAYILGEFLSEHNQPCSFTDFTARAAAQGLQFLCEGDFNASARESIGGKSSPSEQSLDFASGRPFRRSLLTRSGGAVTVPSSDHLRDLHVWGQLNREESGAVPGVVAFVDQSGRRVNLPKGAVSVALTRVADAYPGTVPVRSLLGEIAGAGARGVSEAIFEVTIAGHVHVSAVPICTGRADIERPRVSALNRIEAAGGQPWMTSLHHDGVPLSLVQAAVVQHLDGVHNRAQLMDIVRTTLQRAPQLAEGKSPERIIETTLSYLERNGVLQPIDAPS